MRKHELFFATTTGFVLGAVFGGLGATIIAVGALLLIVATIALLYKISPRAVLITAAFFLLGNLYYGIDDYTYHEKLNAVNDTVQFEGIIIQEPKRRLSDQVVKLRLTGEGNLNKAQILIYAELYPELSYGDLVFGTGSITPPPRDSYGKYLAKEKIHGTAFYPKLDIKGNAGNIVLSWLSAIRAQIKNSINRLFTQRQSAFLSGIILGDRDEFSKDFLDKLSISGTMHLTALSGLHMTIFVFIALAVFSAIYGWRRRPIFVSAFFVILLFVAMTGFKISAIRSSTMAFIVGLAGQTGRVYSPRNAIALAAFILTMANPKAPVFDIAFQLSFAATLSIIYLVPVLKQLSFFQSGGFLNWRTILAITIAAQIGVAPITILNFANFSLTALPANLAILIIMPVLMVSGIVAIASSFIFPPLSYLLSKPVAFLLDYTAGVIEIFSVIRLSFNPELIGIVIICYYATLVWICARWAPSVQISPFSTNQKL